MIHYFTLVKKTAKGFRLRANNLNILIARIILFSLGTALFYFTGKQTKFAKDRKTCMCVCVCVCVCVLVTEREGCRYAHPAKTQQLLF